MRQKYFKKKWHYLSLLASSFPRLEFFKELWNPVPRKRTWQWGWDTCCMQSQGPQPLLQSKPPVMRLIFSFSKGAIFHRLSSTFLTGSCQLCIFKDKFLRQDLMKHQKNKQTKKTHAVWYRKTWCQVSLEFCWWYISMVIPRCRRSTKVPLWEKGWKNTMCAWDVARKSVTDTKVEDSLSYETSNRSLS